MSKLPKRIISFSHPIELEETVANQESVVNQLRNKGMELSAHVLDAEEQGIREQMAEVATRLARGGTTSSTYEEQFKQLSRKECFSALEKNARKLRKLGPVNLRAGILHTTLVEEKAKLEDRRLEFLKVLKKNQAILDYLVESKDSKVQYTYGQLVKNFREVFKLLVPNGNAKLVFERESTQSEDFTGINIRVSFHGNDEMYDLSTLSGGQKSTVALAYMFALQKCDPCPIYVFDEIDANLDVTSRKAIADWLVECKNR